MRWNVVLAVMLLGLASPAAAETLVIEGAEFHYRLPAGACPLDLRNAGQARIFDERAAQLAEHGLRLLVGFYTCTEVASLGHPERRQIVPDGFISVLADRSGAPARFELPRPHFLHRVKQRNDLVDWGIAAHRLKELEEGRGPRAIRLGVIGQDDRAVYVASAQRGLDRAYATVIAVTMLERRAFHISRTRPLDGRRVFERLMAEEQALIGSLAP
jgi:hypothetical protein